FVVHEVDLNGNIARLESLESPQESEAKVEPAVEPAVDTKSNADTAGETTRKRKLSESADLPTHDAVADGVNGMEKPLNIDWNSHRENLSKLIGETPAKEVVLFLEQNEHDKANNETKDDNVKKFYTLPMISDKKIRRSIHLLIKSPKFSLMARADNQDGRIRIWHKRFEAYMPVDTFGRGGDNNRNNPKKNDNGGKRGGGAKRAPWPRDRPDFLRFVLYKENIDTSSAAKDVGRMARLNPKRGIGYAGMKDKRGITTQFCSAYRIEKEQLLAVNAVHNANAESAAGGGNTSGKGSSIITLGNFAYSSDEVKLGTLTGNRFDIVLRNIDVGEDADRIQQILENSGHGLKKYGFVNYFGMQRFGKFHDTHEVGIAIMKGDFEGAVDIIMREKTDESPRIAAARQQWAKRFES
ncbi:hypothetical protein ACHAXR_001207, partial [Thalassiosira sp. AJA248-18]